MIYFDGTYRLRRNHTRSRSDQKWAYAWRVRIIDLTLDQPQVTHLKPYIVFITPSEEGVFTANCADHMGKRVCRDFNLDVGQTLWVECFTNILVATFTPRSQFGPDISYTVGWRSLRANELETLKKFIPEIYSLKF